MKKPLTHWAGALCLFVLLGAPTAQAQESATPLPETLPNQSSEHDLELKVDLKQLRGDMERIVPNRRGELELTFDQAIKLAYLNNLRSLLAEEQYREAKGEYRKGLSTLLPQVDASVFQARRTTNLVGEGLDPEDLNLPSGVLGPFNKFDARIYLVQSVFNLEAIGAYQAGLSTRRLGKMRIELARQKVFNMAGLAYVNMQKTQADVEAAEADLELSETLYEMTKVAFDAGVVTGVDKARAEANLEKNRTLLVQAKAQAETAQLKLKKILMIPLGTPVVLTSKLREKSPSPPGVDRALQIAALHRPDLMVAKETVRLRHYEARSALGQQIPSLGFGANYGLSGDVPDSDAAGTYQFGGQLSIPIFDGGNSLADITIAKSKKRQAGLALSNMREEVNKEVRDALVNYNAAREEIISTKKYLDVSKLEMELTRDRFFSGVGDNLEVVRAQDSLAQARDAYVNALSKFNASRVQLATAMGTVEGFQF